MKPGTPPTAAQTAAALRTLVVSRYEGNFGNLTRAILGDDTTHFRAVNAQLWRAHSEKKPSHLDPELAKKILVLFPRAKNDKEKKALAVIREASKHPPREKKTKPQPRRRIRTTRRTEPAPNLVTAALQVAVLSGDQPIGTFVATYDGQARRFNGDIDVRLEETEVVLSVRIPKSQALGLFLN